MVIDTGWNEGVCGDAEKKKDHGFVRSVNTHWRGRRAAHVRTHPQQLEVK